jgi:hypothetical protein
MNNYQKIVEKDFIYYYIITIKWGESTHFPGAKRPEANRQSGRNDPVPSAQATKGIQKP